MKKILLFLLLLIGTFQVSEASQSKVYEKTYWNFLRAKLFNGNSYVFRFHDDIKLQLYGQPTMADSLYIVQLIEDLNGLMETCQIELVKDSGNFVLTIDHPARSGQKLLQRISASPSGTILKRNIALNFSKELSQEERNIYINYYLVR